MLLQSRLKVTTGYDRAVNLAAAELVAATGIRTCSKDFTF